MIRPSALYLPEPGVGNLMPSRTHSSALVRNVMYPRRCDVESQRRLSVSSCFTARYSFRAYSIQRPVPLKYKSIRNGKRDAELVCYQIRTLIINVNRHLPGVFTIIIIMNY